MLTMAVTGSFSPHALETAYLLSMILAIVRQATQSRKSFVKLSITKDDLISMSLYKMHN